MKADVGQLRRALASPPPDLRLYLFHGPDEAGAMVAATQLAAALGPAIERIDLEGAALRKDPARLATEAASLSLFGEARLIRVTALGEESLDALSLLLAAERSLHPVVAIAPGVRASSRVVRLAIDSPLALASAFYEPGAADLERITNALAREHGLIAEPGVARRISEAAGGNRAVIAREIEKLQLFLDADPGRPVPLDDAALAAVGADLGEAAADELVAALVDGEPAVLGEAVERLTASGASPVPWLRAITRRLLAIAAMRAEIDGGESPAAVMKRHRVFFREEGATLAALRRWSPAMLARAVDQVRVAERAMMASGTAGGVLAEASVLAIARGVAARR